MIGRGRAWGAISVVNALPTGIGGAAAVSLRMEATVECVPGGSEGREFRLDAASDTPLVRACLSTSFERVNRDWSGSVALRLTSEIPPGRGLKSSSAVGVAVARAIGSAFGRTPSAEEAANLSAEAGIRAGRSATGAFDDALASAAGGIVLTDNPHRRILAYDEVPSDWRALLWVPDRSHAPAPTWLDAFRSRIEDARAIVDAARSRRFAEAIERNGELVESVLGYSYGPLRSQLRKRGAIASGVSGLGPALAVVARSEDRARIRPALPRSGRVLDVEFVRRAPEPSTSRGPR